MKLVTAAILRDGNTVMVVRRGPGEKLAGYWEFPGGKVEPSETLQECLEREMFEELDIVTKVTDLVAVSDYRYDNGEIKLVALETKIVSGNMKLKVHDQIKWLHPTEILALKLAPADIAIAQALCGKTNDI
jgi:8-oxo-dGTP diphosphatase